MYICYFHNKMADNKSYTSAIADSLESWLNMLKLTPKHYHTFDKCMANAVDFVYVIVSCTKPIYNYNNMKLQFIKVNYSYSYLD